MRDVGWVFLVVGMALLINGAISAIRRDAHARSGSSVAWIDVLTGRSLEEILGRVGPPARDTGLDDGGRVLAWDRTGCEIALTFDAGGICRAVRVGAEPDAPAGRPRSVGHRSGALGRTRAWALGGRPSPATSV